MIAAMATPVISPPSTPRASTRVTVHRTSDDDVKDRQLLISLDGVRIATLLFGQTKSVEIQQGQPRAAGDGAVRLG